MVPRDALVTGVDGNSLFVGDTDSVQSSFAKMDSKRKKDGVDFTGMEIVTVQTAIDAVRKIAIHALLEESVDFVTEFSINEDGRGPLCIMATELGFNTVESFVEHINEKMSVFVTSAVDGQQVTYNPTEIKRYVTNICEELRVSMNTEKSRKTLNMA